MSFAIPVANVSSLMMSGLRLLVLCIVAAAAAAAALARPPAVRRVALRMSDRQLGTPTNPYISKSPQQQQYEAQQRAAYLRQQQQQQLSPMDRQRQAYRNRVQTGSSKDVFLQSSWFDTAKGGIVALAIAAALGGAGWQGLKIFKGRQTDLIDALADALVYKGKSTSELQRTLKSYEKQLGPGTYKPRIMAKYISALAAARPTTAETILAFKAAQQVLGISDAAMPAIIGMAAETHLAESPSIIGKLLFIAERAVSPSAAAPLRSKLPYGPEQAAALQQMMLEKAFRAVVLAKADDLMTASIPAESATLGLSKEEAQKLLAKMQAEEAEERRRAAAEADEALDEERARLELAASLVEEVRKETKPYAAPAPAPAPAPTPSAGKALECQSCGYTLFPAAGREFKFYGDDFKCPQCGAGKDKFTESTDSTGSAGQGSPKGSDDDYEPATA